MKGRSSMNLDTTIIEQYFLDKSIENARDH